MKEASWVGGLQFPPPLFLRLGLAWVAPVLFTGFAAGALFYDDFENGLGRWQVESPWGLTTGRFASPTHSATNSPGAYYTNRTDAALAMAVSVNLAGTLRPVLGFVHYHALEPGYDFGLVEVSTKGGASWLPTPLAAYTGSTLDMTREQLDLSPYAGAANVRIRFRLVTDASVVMDGWYVDDVLIGEAPVVIPAPALEEITSHSIRVTWPPRDDPWFA
ncbi:hypothetical protein G4L39_11130 [Limisphaera ngatamarikiensis]|uniref:Uncharacterized protein n=1 Tax=Limisphaera ngatamarikiensis TaxID=1324935 RepID=A0A6M1RIP4_9BACT|nr:immune inhibitor A domain-containing protein [Limisphaera ngatamarikiensis]NGO39938.1 hypothetical protein [Limisphaera ngatamarikiensis]